MSIPVLRYYARTLSDIKDILPYAYACPNKEIQIVLAFARDYDRQGNYTIGKFSTYFDTVTPQDIQTIKNDPANSSVKFFLSIGGRDTSFPFAVNSKDQSSTWILEATASLRSIIQKYHIDGIDVYYEYINSTFFATSIAPVIQNLKGGKNGVTKASITVSDPLIDLYEELYRACPDTIDNVVYQCFTFTNPIHTPPDLVAVFVNTVSPRFNMRKILAGYSDWPGDQTNVKPAIIFRALALLLSHAILGFSMWHGNPAP